MWLDLRTGKRCPRPISWEHPAHWNPPHRVTHVEKLEKIYDSFITVGWLSTRPSLVGYRDEDGWQQLVSGSHRRAAALLAGIRIPVRIYSYFVMQEAWGNLEEWFKIVGNDGFD